MRRIRSRLFGFVAVVAAIVSGVALFRISQQVQVSESKRRHLEAALASEREAIRVLNAEWDYLNRPDRLEELAREHLDMKAPTARQMDDTTLNLPSAQAEPEAAASHEKSIGHVKSQPAAPVRPLSKPVAQAVVKETRMVKQEGSASDPASAAGVAGVVASPLNAKSKTAEPVSDEKLQEDFRRMINSIAPSAGGGTGRGSGR